MIHARRARSHNHGARRSRDHRIPFAFWIFARCQGFRNKSEREVAANGDIVRIGIEWQFAEVLRGARYRGGPLLRNRLRRRESGNAHLRKLECREYELFGGKSRLRETETQSGKIQGFRIRTPRMNFRNPRPRRRFRRSESVIRCRRAQRWRFRLERGFKRETPFWLLVSGRRDITRHLSRHGIRQFRRFFRIRGGTRKRSVVRQFDVSARGRRGIGRFQIRGNGLSRELRENQRNLRSGIL